jgi:hypothetical protein
MPHKFSRSHQEALHTCPRLCWLRYYADGTGYESVKLDVARSTGSLLHSIITTLLQFVRATDRLPDSSQIDKAVVDALAEYKAEANQRGLDLEQQGDMVFELQRQAHLAEGLARAWVRVRLPQIHEQYKVACVEQEWEVALDPQMLMATILAGTYHPDDVVNIEPIKVMGGGEIVDMVRIDAVLSRRADGELWPLELKTTGWISEDWLESWRYDSQMLQHVWACERHFPLAVCGGVLLEAFYKGVKRKDDQTGVTTWYSPLIHAYLHRGAPPFDEDQIVWDSSFSRRKGWEPLDVWNWGGTEAKWVEMMPDELLTNQLYSREIMRSTREQEIWVRQTIPEQQDVQWAVERLADLAVTEKTKVGIMDHVFPAILSKDCFSNKYRRRCSMIGVCYDGLNPADSQEFRPREPHHAGEREEE